LAVDAIATSDLRTAGRRVCDQELCPTATLGLDDLDGGIEEPTIIDPLQRIDTIELQRAATTTDLHRAELLAGLDGLRLGQGPIQRPDTSEVVWK